MPIQTVIFGMLLATLYGTIFHLWKGGKLWRLLVFLILAWIGFWGGHFLGVKLGLVFFEVGSLDTGLASLMSFITLGLGYWLIFGNLAKIPERKS